MLLREGRALRRDRHGETAGVAADHVDLPFAHDRLAARGLDDARRGVGEGEQHVRLLEEDRLGRIDVLRLLLVVREDAPRKRDRAVLAVRDREHEASAEAVVPGAALELRRQQHAGGDEILVGEAVLLRPRAHGVRGERRVADLELGDDRVRQRAAREVDARRLGLLRLLEATAEEIGKLAVELQLAFALSGLRVLLLLHRDPARAGEFLHGLDERHALLLLHELDAVARLAAAEAVVEPLVGLDVEGRRLLVVERTARHVAAARAAELDAIRGDQVGQVGPRLDLLDRRLWYAERHHARPASSTAFPM